MTKWLDLDTAPEFTPVALLIAREERRRSRRRVWIDRWAIGKLMACDQPPVWVLCDSDGYILPYNSPTSWRVDPLGWAELPTPPEPRDV